MIIDTLRPNATTITGSWTAVPSGTLHGVTSDDSDTTYATTSDDTGMQVAVPAHTPAADHQRHAIRARMRGRSSGADGWVRLRPGRPGSGVPVPDGPLINLTSTIGVFAAEWRVDDAGYALSSPNPQVYAAFFSEGHQAATGSVARVMEAYVDIDTRAKPTFTPQILDGAGVDQTGGTITDTNIARSRFTAENYDGLPARTWRVAVYTLTQTLQVGFEPFVTVPLSEASGNGAAADAVHVLPNDDYVAYYQLFSTIRVSDAFASDIEPVSFTVAATPALAPANMTVTPQTDPPAFVVCWDAPADAANWTEPANVYVEVVRRDCNGEHQIALIPDALDGCYTDRFAPLASQGRFCEAPDHECEVCYDIRYWGYQGVTLEPITTAIPAGVILAWPDTDAAIPSNWTRVAALDDRYPKGVPDAVTNPGTNGGTATHGHVAAAHDHDLDHDHAQAATGAATGNKVNRNINAPTASVAGDDHTHTRPTSSTAAINSGSASPTPSTVPNEAPRKEVVFVESDGVDTTVPAGMLAIQHASSPAPGWQSEDSNGAGAAARPPYWKGAAPAGDGSLAFITDPSHTHTLPNHTHTGPSHGHTSGQTGTPSVTEITRDVATVLTSAATHRHDIAVTNAAAAALTSAGLVTTGTGAGDIAADPLFRATSFIESLTGPQFVGLIGLWLDPIASIPIGWQLCDGTNGTPDFLGRYPRHKGSLSVNLTGGGAAHSHTRAAHAHPTSGHSHPTSLIGSALQVLRNFLGIDSDPRVLNEDPSFSAPSSPGAPHAHTAANTNSMTPSVGSGGAASLDAAGTEPEHTEIAYIMLAETGSSPSATQLLIVSETATFCVDAQANPVEGCDWLRGFIDGDICICPDRTFARTRPFGRFQPIAGGFPIITSGTPGGRDYTLSWGVESEDDLELCESILAQVIVHFTPADQRPLFMAPDPLTVDVVKVDAVRLMEASFYEVDPPPIPDPADVIPEPPPTSP